MKKAISCLASLFAIASLQAASLIGIRADENNVVFALNDVMSIKVSESDLMTVNTFNGESAGHFQAIKFSDMGANVENLNSDSNIKVYPNPVKNVLYLVGASESTLINIIDMKGKSVLTGNGESINVENLSKGMYIISAEGKSVKFIKD